MSIWLLFILTDKNSFKLNCYKIKKYVTNILIKLYFFRLNIIFVNHYILFVI